jgi:alpha-mannosidase
LKKVLFNQFHDLAAGSGIGQIYKDAQKDYDVVRWSTNEIDAGALSTIAAQIDTHSKEVNTIPIIVYNPLGWDRSGDVKMRFQWPRDHSGVLQVFDEESKAAGLESLPIKTITTDDKTGVTELTVYVWRVPAFGYKVLRIISTPHEYGMSILPINAKETAKSATLGTKWLHVTIDKETGCIISITFGGIESLVPGACGNQLQAFKDTPKEYDAWNIDPGTLDQALAMPTRVDSVELFGENSPDPSVRITRTWQNSKFIQTIRIDENTNQIDIDNEIDWHESHVLLKAAFQLAASGPFATYEIPYGTIDRATTRNNSWEQAQFEVPAMRWADLSGPGPDGKIHGLSILNQSKYGYDAVGNTLRLTLLRSPKWPDAEADMGHHHFHYALYPHAGTWKDALTVRHGYEYNYPLIAVVTTAHPGTLPASHSFASVEPENVVLTAVKKAEDTNGLIFRVYEWAGKETTAEFHVPPGATSATVTNLMETPEGSQLAVVDDVVKAPIHPYEILTIRVDYPTCGGAGGACAP